MNWDSLTDRLRRGLVPAALVLLVILTLARITRPTAAGQVEAEEKGAPAETAPRLVGARPFFQVSVLPTDTPTPALPTDTPTPALPTDTPTPALPTDTPTPALPTDTPTAALPTDTPTAALPTDTPTAALPTDTPTAALPTDTPTVALPTDTPTVALPTDTPTVVPPTDTPTPVPIPPVILDLTVYPSDGVVPVEEEIFISADFNSFGDVTAEWFWGDDPSPTSQSDVSSPAQASHAYEEAGIYTVELRITNDSTGDFDTATYEFVVVYDPSGGFVTGGGWIDSPAGAYIPDPTLSGKANFGFVSKYTKGNQAPTGNTHFQFKVAGLNFSSTSYDWLIVAGSDTAIFKGSGTLNGQRTPNNELYNFKIWAGDGEPDTFRIRIWWEPGMVEDPIYDSHDNLPIGGGSIVIHKGKKN